MRNFKNIAVTAAIFLCASAALVSCGDKASVNCTVTGAPESEVVVKLLNINRYEVLDTIRTNASGQCSYKVTLQKQQPEFVYLFYKDTKIASLLLQKGDKVSVAADTLGNYSVTGSEESLKLQEVERRYSAFISDMIGLGAKMDSYPEDSPEAKGVQQEITKRYVDYYRENLKYVMSNSHSLTTVPVFFQTMGGGVPVFSQETDAIHFNAISDSLETVYPDSKYVKALRQEALKRTENLELSHRIRSAAEVNYLDIEMPDVQGVKRKLSEVDSKAVLIHFWSAAMGTQKMFNIEVLKPVYEQYKDRGLEIYQVALDTDKANWARVIREQGLGWINVCDGLGTSSPVVSAYNIVEYPVTYLLVDGNLENVPLSDAATLSRTVGKYLK